MPKAKLPATPQGRRRLLKLAKLLEANAKNKKGCRFDYGDWGSIEDPYQKPGLNCGTTACALGLAAISGKFPGLGYKIGRGNYSIMIRLAGRGNRDLGNFQIGAKYFGITMEQSHYLFSEALSEVGNLGSSGGAKAERAVAKAIKRFVAGKGPYADAEADIAP